MLFNYSMDGRVTSFTSGAISAPTHISPPIHFASLSSTQCSRLFELFSSSLMRCNPGKFMLLAAASFLHFIDEKAGELQPIPHPRTKAPRVA